MYQLKTVLVSICVLASQAVSAFDVGVGFSLAIDYGVASVHFSNGTTVNVAKIQGPEAYKLAMTAAPDWSWVDFTDDALDAETPSSKDNGSLPVFSNPIPTTQTSLLTRSLRDHLPPWLGGPKPPNPPTLALQNMLRLLTLSTENYLSTSLSTIGITTPYPINPTTRHLILSALPQKAFARVHVATSLADWVANPPDPSKCPGPFDPPDAPVLDDELVLGLDCSRAALTATLAVVMPGCGVWETVRVGHWEGLGAGEVFGGEEGADELRGKLAEAVRRVTELPCDVGTAGGIDFISRIVLMGDEVRDVRFQELVREVLSETFSGGAQALSAQFENGELDPVHIAAVGGAVWAQQFELANFQVGGSLDFTSV